MVCLRYVNPWTPFIPNNPCRTLLEFRLNAESSALYDIVILDVPVSDVARHLELDGGQKLFSRSPFLTIPSQRLVFDMRTRAFYGFPDFCITLVCCDQQKGVGFTMAHRPLGYIGVLVARSRERPCHSDRAHKYPCYHSSRPYQRMEGPLHPRTSLHYP